MRPRPARVPWLASRLLRLAVGAAAATDVEANLRELHALRVRRAGRSAAWLWYWRQAVGFVWRRRALRGLPGRVAGAGAWARDLRLAVRSLAAQPAFTALAIVTLALGIGANTAIFSVLYGSLLRPLPYAAPERLAWISDAHENFGGPGANISVPNFLDLQQASRLMQSSAIYKVRSGNLATAGDPERVTVLYASASMLATLGVTPRLGRDLLPEDDEFGRAGTAILTDALWRTRFGADLEIVGTSIVIDARTVQVAGVAPPEFSFPENPQLIMALQHDGAPLRRGNRGHFAIARLTDAATIETLREELQGIYAGLVQQYPNFNEGFTVWAEPLGDAFVGRNQRSLLLLAGGAVLVLVIACVNVANLMLVRAEGRQREFAVRYSLGATRAALVPLFLGEGLVLSLVGGTLGVAVAAASTDVLVALYGQSLARAGEIQLNGTVLAFALVVALLVGVAVGLVPLLRTGHLDVHETVKDGGRGSSAGGSRLGRVLVVSEVALAVLVVAAAGLLSHSIWRLQALDLGVTDERQVLTFRLSLPTARYAQAEDVGVFFRELVERLERVPGVQAAGVVNRLPLLGGDNTSVSSFEDPDAVADFVSNRMVTHGYFEAVGARLVAGRLLDDRELVDGGRGLVINRTLARHFFGEGDAVGRRLKDSLMPPDSPLFAPDGLEIVGVIDDIAGGRPGEPAPAAFYFAVQVAIDMLAMMPDLVASEQIGMSVLARASGDPYALLPAIRALVRQLDPEVPVFEVRTLAEIATSRLGTRRFAMSLFGAFAGLALLLGAVGIYGVMSYGVTQRSRELGVRMALGADRKAVSRLVLREGARLIVPGLAIGMALALATGRLLGSLLYEVSATDPATLAAVALVLAAVGAAACYLPARRATRVDPLTVMRG